MSKQVGPNIVAFILIAVTVAFLAIMPVSIQITPNTTVAQAATATTGTADMNMDAASSQPRTVEYTLKTVIGLTPPMAFIGVGGDIDGVINPPLTANVGDTVRITVINGDPVMHDLKIDEFNVFTGELTEKDQEATVEFVPDRPGDFVYYCNQPGHRQIGMFGTLTVTGEASTESVNAAPALEVAAVPTVAPAAADAVSIVRNPADLPAPVGDRGTNQRPRRPERRRSQRHPC